MYKKMFEDGQIDVNAPITNVLGGVPLESENSVDEQGRGAEGGGKRRRRYRKRTHKKSKKHHKKSHKKHHKKSHKKRGKSRRRR